MARGLDEEETAVNAGVLNVALSLGSEFLSEICRVLVLDVLDDGIPAKRCQHNKPGQIIIVTITICHC